MTSLWNFVIYGELTQRLSSLTSSLREFLNVGLIFPIWNSSFLMLLWHILHFFLRFVIKLGFLRGGLQDFFFGQSLVCDYLQSRKQFNCGLKLIKDAGLHWVGVTDGKSLSWDCFLELAYGRVYLLEKVVNNSFLWRYRWVFCQDFS